MKKLFVILAGILMLTVSIHAQTIYTVTKTGDPDPFLYPYNYIDSLCDTTMHGTLQWAVRKANDTQGTCEIRFAIAGSGQQIIALNYYLPSIRNTVKIDGTTQSGYQNGVPSIIIDGGNMVNICFIIQSQQCEIKGLYIRNFSIGLSVLSSYVKIHNNVINQCIDGIEIMSNNAEVIGGEVTGNIIGTDNTMSVLLNISQYGIFLYNTSNNVIGGVQTGQGNIIANCHVGIMVSYNTSQNLFSRNQIFNNPYAIFYKEGSPVLKPIITSATNNTVSGTSAPNDIIEIFGSTGGENANEYLATTQTDGNGNWTTSANTTYSNVIATATDGSNNTSVLSNSKVISENDGTFPSPQNTEQMGSLTPLINKSICGLNYSVGNVRLTNRFNTPPTSVIQPAAINISGIPPGAIIENAYLWWMVERASTNTYDICVLTSPSGTTYSVNGTLIGQNPNGNAWGGNVKSYRADVTNFITAPYNGNYLINGLPVSINLSDADGATLMIIYRNPNNNINGNLIINDGLITNNWSSSITTSLSGFIVNSFNGTGNAFVQLADFQNSCPNSTISLNSSLPTTFTQDFWDYETQNTIVTSGQTTSNFQISIVYNNSLDAISLQFAGLYYQSLECTCSNIILNTSQTNVSCNGGSNGTATVTATGGTTPYTSLWSNGNTSQTSTNLTAGTWTVTVTDANGCTSTASVTITQPTAITPSITAQTNVSCFGGSNGTATANGSGGMPPYFYLWSNSQNTQTATSLITGIYFVTVYDSNGCTAVNSVNITEPQPLSFTVTFVNPLCTGSADGTATITVTGGTPYHWTFPLPPSGGYMFQWSDGIQSFIPAFSHTNTDMQSGFYTVTITDANNCTAVASVTLSDPPAININLTANLPTCFGYSNGSINSVVSGGTAPYNYIWSTGQTTPDITGVSAGTYLLTVTDASGCTNISSILVTHPHELATTITGTSPLCFNGASGSVNLTVIGGTTPYIYIWSNGATTEDLNNVPGGFYSVTVTDIFGCTSTANLSVTEPPLLTAVITGTNVVCGNATGSVTVNANGGTSPYTYVWDDPPPAQTTQTCYGLTGGIWNVTVTDANGCTTSASFEISVVPPLFNVSGIVSQTDPCVSLCNGFIDLTVTPVGTYSFQWNDGINNFATTEDVSNLCNYQYYVTITDQSGCLITQSYNVPVIPGYPTGSNVYISGLTIINDNMQHPYAQNIFIQNGGTLIVDGIGTELQFLHHKKIIMQGGSTLIVRNGAKLNSYCLMWDGISAYSGSASNPVNISIETDGIVENAIWGIYANGYVNVNCTTAHFINNWIDIYLYQTRLQPYIANCEFITNIPILQYAPYYSTTYKYPFAHIRTYKIGVDYNKIIFNTFTNTNTFTDASYQGMGIYAQNSSFKNITYCNFNYLWYGINALTCQIRVEHNNFAGNNRGVLGSNSTTMLYSNTFNVSYNGNQNTMATYPYGASIQNCNNYQVQENTFQNGFAGLFMVNNPQTGKQIYKNTFDNLEFAFIANGTNGVKLTCNDFGLTAANNLRNIYMYNGSINSIQNHAVIAATPPYQSINTHNRFAIDKDTWPDSYKFSKNIASPGGYQYYWGVYNPPLVNDLTRIEPPTPFPAWAIPISTPAFDYIASRCTSLINGGKSMSKELTKVDSLKTALVYNLNYYNALVDNGNTENILAYVQNMQPNNFTQIYNNLMEISPYLSDTVLITFMIHPINKPAHKKNVVLACSPLPFKVRPYIDQMNINQNFKNQIWAAQSGINERVELEHELANRDFGINSIFGDLIISAVLIDSVPEKIDTLLNYVLQNGTLSERMLTSPLFIEKERYSDALNNLTEVSFLNETGNSQITDFIQLQLLKIQLAQAPDSIRDSLILINESWINPIAYDTTHFCMEDALNLLEGVYDTLYPRNVYVGSSPNTKRQPFISFKSDDYDCGLQIHPNPAHKYVNIVISKSESDANNELRLCDINGKVIQVYKEISEYIKIDLKNKNPGVYYLILMNKVSVVCSKKLVIE